MKKVLRWGSRLVVILLFAAILYGGTGYYDALVDADRLLARANVLLELEQGPANLGPGRSTILLAVQDPAFLSHSGVDLSTPGAGLTTITQSVSKRLAFDDFRPGVGKLRQTGYALGLEARLNKTQIFTLFLETVEMGKGPEGWMTGFFEASEAIYGKPPADLEQRDFLRLVAVMIAPSQYDLMNPGPELFKRVTRIKKLIAGDCQPSGNRDVWLDGCA